MSGTPEQNDRPGFLGFRRPDGRVGTRNHVLVVPTVICSSLVAERIAAAALPLGTALPHLAGCGQLGPDMRLTHETLAAYCAHPNVGAVIVVALGCEQVVAQMLADAARRQEKPVEIVAIQAEGGTVRATEKGIGIARAFAGTLAGQQREWCDISELVLSLKCGGSDYTSGLASNPTLGRVTDRLVDMGGSAVLGEIA
jgi:altronate dehydratase large subunit